MKRIVLGLIVLAILTVVPISAALVNAWNDEQLLQPPALVPLLKIVSAILVGAVGALLFIRMSGLRGRLAARPKGASLMLAGSLMFIAFPALLAVLAHTHNQVAILSFFPAYGLTQFPAYLILMVGAIRVLLHLEPAHAGQQLIAEAQPQE